MKNNQFTTLTKIKNFSLNFGPQHPAAHGVLRLILHLEGENLKKIDPHIGLLHRGTEKLIEKKTYLQALPYFDRLDYVSTMSQEHCYSLAIEQLFNMSITTRSSYIRVLFLELTRILNHLMAVTTHALDLGALTPFLWAFEEREIFMEFYERVCGARLHAAYIIPGGVSFELPKMFIYDLRRFCYKFCKKLDSLESLLTDNLIWKYRLKNIGVVSKFFAKQFSYTGVLLRSTGIPLDLRDSMPYECYLDVKFKLFIGINGDCFDRYLIRIWEMRQSIDIILKMCSFLSLYSIYEPPVIFSESNFKLGKGSHFFLKNSMESMISHFIFNSRGILLKDFSNFVSTETPKGEFGLFLVTRKQSQYIYRCRIRAPGFFHLQSLHALGSKHMLADLVAIIGTQDIVFGEIDR